ncbi:hypothetical protein GL297_08780 [Komagataeibacter sp. FXV2]|nr:hypothetical protein [Komagataeibacter sp. FXV2]
MPAQAQDTLRVVDARGHQVGILVPAPDVSGVAEASDIAMFDALDRMMARDMAAMEATHRELMAHVVQSMHTIPSVDHNAPNRGASWQSFEVVSIGGPAASCTQTVTMTSNGRSAPIIHTSSTGGNACAALAAPVSVGKPERKDTRIPDLVPAVDTHAVLPGEDAHNGRPL